MKKLGLFFLLICSIDVVSAQEFSFQTGHTNDILEVKFNSEATKLISYSAGDGWLILWDVKSGRQLWRSRTEFVQKAKEYYTLTSFAFNPDESLIASGSGNGTVQLWDAKTGKPLWRVEAHTDSVTAVEFSPDGKSIVSAASPKKDDDEVKILQTENGQILKKLQGKSCTVAAISFSVDGKTLKTGNLDGNVMEWDMNTGMQNYSKSVPTCGIRRTHDWETSFTSDLQTAAKRKGEEQLSLIDTKIGTEINEIRADGGLYIRSKISGDGRILVYEKSGDFIFYNLGTGERRQADMFSGTGSTIDISKDGSLFAEGAGWGDASIKITDTKTGQSKLLIGHPGEVKAVAYTPDGKFLAVAGSDRNIYVFDANEHTLQRTLVGHKVPIDSIAFSPDGKTLLSSAKEENVRVWKWQEISQPQNSSEPNIKGVKKVAFSPDGKRFLVMGDGQAQFMIVDAKSLKTIRTIGTNEEYKETHGEMTIGYKGIPISDLLFAKDGNGIVANHYDQTLRFWDINSGKQIRQIKIDKSISFMQVVPDGKTILAAVQIDGDYQIKLFNASTGKVITEFDDEESCCLDTLILSPDARHFATSDVVGDVLLWEINKKKPIRTFDVGGSSDDAIAFSPEGKTLAVGGKNQNLFLFEVNKGDKLWQLIPSYQPTELEIKLNKEKEQRQTQLDQIQAGRDKQASIDLAKFVKEIYITFEHYGEMINPGELRMLESDKPNKSKTKKPSRDANAIWLRLHNDAPLPIKIPTQSMYSPNPDCFYPYSDKQKLIGLCDNREISIWFGLEDKNGKPIRYGFDFGSSAILLPKTSVLFAVPKEILKGNNSIGFEYIFQKEVGENDIGDYGKRVTLKFSESDLPRK
jgi:WD40 repeat protein